MVSMPTRHSGQIQTVLKCKRDTFRNSIIKWRCSRTNLLHSTTSAETTIQYRLPSPWEIFQTTPTFKLPSWMTELKVDRLISMTIAQSNLCKIESSSWMTKKVLLKCSMKLMPTILVSESAPSITCRSLILPRVVQSKDKDNWTRNHHYSISSFLTTNQPRSLSLLRPQTLAQFRSIQLITPQFNTDCFPWARTSSERVLRTSLIDLMPIGNLSRLIFRNLLTSFTRMSTKLHHDQLKSQRWVSLPISLRRPWWTKRSSGRHKNWLHHPAAKCLPWSKVEVMANKYTISNPSASGNSR